jgi:hypothetical protein
MREHEWVAAGHTGYHFQRCRQCGAKREPGDARVWVKRPPYGALVPAPDCDEEVARRVLES